MMNAECSDIRFGDPVHEAEYIVHVSRPPTQINLLKGNAMIRTQDTAAQEAYVPGSAVTGMLNNIDRARGMFVLRLLKGARGWLSIYDVTDEEFDKYVVGSLISATVDRVETDADGYVHVVLKRD
jgi:hypothetical protein